ncbi:ATP-binding protein [Longimicrobium sp.]|uniref:AAA family ATPase n=1 Tax=Longimicrobium sp. TaxID=2029185 RepID=UPI002CB79F4F|nr:ATP-binding protein [Longimicrobium sp.]HSU14764.1 ATP-binding protein [Longimicrobium sp.]
MLIRFRVKNYRSIRDEQEFSLVASTMSELPEAVARPSAFDFGVLRSAALYGPNASGKSTLCSALQFMKSAVTDSHKSWDPGGGISRDPFALDTTSVGEPSSFIVDVSLDNIRYEYGFVVDSSRVLEEWLYAYPKGRRQEWFTRTYDLPDEFAFSRLLSGENRTIAALTRPNSLFLSAAAQNNHQMLSPLHEWFSKQLRVIEAGTFDNLTLEVSERCLDPDYRAKVFDILKSADLGITEIEVLEDDQEGAARARMLDKMMAVFGSSELASVKLVHRTNGRIPVALPFKGESAGTRTLFALAGAMVEVMTSGGTLVVDELDRSLHPHLALKIVRMFNDPETNPNGAQLIFNTHDTNLLDTELLRRDQIWFTEKGDDGATRLFPLTDFRARKHENLERGYLQGRFGAVPSVRTPPTFRRTGS